MLKRLYVNNFRSLVAFEAQFEPFAVFCGPNGAGKSSVFDALLLLRNLGTGDAVLGGKGELDVPSLDLTKWVASRTQHFEASFLIDGSTFDYMLQVEQTTDLEKPRIVEESAKRDGQVLFERDLNGVRFPRADGGFAMFPLDWRHAALAALRPQGKAIAPLQMLQEEFERLLIVRPNPRSMEAESKAESRQPDLSISNLTSWYRSLAQEQDWTDSLRDALRQIWPDFRSFKQVDVGGNAKALQLRFESDASPKPIHLTTSELSDGERALIALYMIRTALETGSARTVLIDEPDNFVGLPELQPWLLSMRELLDHQHQCLIISHHPELLANSGDTHGRYIWRDSHMSPTRIGPLKVPAGVSAAEAVARGWVNG